MAIPSVDDAIESMRKALGGAIGNVNVGVQFHSAIVQAAVQRESSEVTIESARKLEAALGATVDAQERSRQTTIEATNILQASIGALTDASNSNTAVMSKWAKSTARWTMWLTFATVALFASAIVQVLVMWFSLFRL